MRKSIRISWQVLFRSIRLLIPFVALLMVSVVYMLWEYQYNPSPIGFLTTSLNAGIICFAYFVFTSYELGSYLRRVEGNESISAIKGASWRLACAHIIVESILLVVWVAVILGGQIIVYYLRMIQYPLYIVHCFCAILLYCFLPGLIGILLGNALAPANQSVAYGVMVLSALMVSPVPTKLFSGAVIWGVSIMQFLDWFAIGVPNPTWTADGVYGIAMETSHWVLAGFWILCLSAVLMGRMNKKRRFVKWSVLGIVILALGCGIRFGARGNDSLVQKDYRPEGTLRHEYNYRRENKTDEVVNAEFAVEKYDLHFDIKDKLEATAKIYLAENELTHYKMTLYRGFDVKSVTDEQNRQLAFTRNGDFLEIETDGTVQMLEINYSGTAGKYYVNRQGIALPGYFVYYPVPGYLQLWDATNGAMAVHTEFVQTEFHVTVDSALDVISNLPEVEDNQFAGMANTVTLYAGLIKAEQKDGVNYYYSPVDRYRDFLDVDAITNKWEELCALVGETRKLELEGKDIFFQAETIITTNSVNEPFVVFDDHILLFGNYTSAELICEFYLMEGIPDRTETELLKEAFYRNLYFSDVESVNKKPSYEELDLLKKYGSAGEISDIDEWNNYLLQADDTFIELFRYQMAALGKEYVLQEVYQYLMESEHSVDQVDFLYELGGEEDA